MKDKENQNNMAGFSRVERDDRLLDVFSRETREKGVELWEKWNSDNVEIIRIHNGNQTHHSIPRTTIESALLHKKRLSLPSFYKK